MEVIVKIDGLGIGIPKTGFGLNAFSGSYIQLNSTAGKPHRTYGVVNYLSAGGNSGTFIYGSAQTAPIKVTPEEFNRFSLDNVRGKYIEVEVKGTIIGSGKADVVISFIDGEGRSEEALERKHVDVSGGQLATTRVRGRARIINSIN